MDWNHVATLLQIIHQAAEAGPRFAKVGSMAQDELLAYVAEANQPEEESHDE